MTQIGKAKSAAQSALSAGKIISNYFTAKHEALPQKDAVTRKDRPAETAPAPLREGIDYYLENGRYVFTEHFLRQRGYCCQSGCRHCPYGFHQKNASTEASEKQ